MLKSCDDGSAGGYDDGKLHDASIGAADVSVYGWWDGMSNGILDDMEDVFEIGALDSIEDRSYVSFTNDMIEGKWDGGIMVLKNDSTMEC